MRQAHREMVEDLLGAAADVYYGAIDRSHFPEEYLMEILLRAMAEAKADIS